MDKCPGLIGGLNDASTTCNINSPIDEVVSGSMSALPGNNPLGQWGVGAASVASSVVASATSAASSKASSVAASASSVASGASSAVSSALGVATSAVSSALGVATSVASVSVSIPSVTLPTYGGVTLTSASSKQTQTGKAIDTHIAAAAGDEIVSSSVVTSGGQVFTSVVTVHASTLIYETVSVTAGQPIPTSSSSSSPATISGYSYAGCYADTGSRVLSRVTFADVRSVTNTACVAYCETKGYSVAGTEFGNQCFCGDSVPSKTLDAAKCHMSCVGDKKEVCGGVLALSVYSKGSGSKKEKRVGRHLNRHALRD